MFLACSVFEAGARLQINTACSMPEAKPKRPHLNGSCTVGWVRCIVGDDPPAEKGRGQEQAEPLAFYYRRRATMSCSQRA